MLNINYVLGRREGDVEIYNIGSDQKKLKAEFTVGPLTLEVSKSVRNDTQKNLIFSFTFTFTFTFSFTFTFTVIFTFTFTFTLLLLLQV